MFSSNTILRRLDLNGNNIGDYGIFKLTKSLKRNTNFTSLSLSHNKFTVEGFKEIASLLQKNYTINSLDLKGNKLSQESDEGFLELCKSLTLNTSLSNLELLNIKNIPFATTFSYFSTFLNSTTSLRTLSLSCKD
uniref:Uncharacterized protein n=1 Tax=Arcella intermedia TaxID=1963864 RepID=A0A6B2LMD2_9EUKA